MQLKVIDSIQYRPARDQCTHNQPTHVEMKAQSDPYRLLNHFAALSAL
jgi:hypothetical protein